MASLRSLQSALDTRLITLQQMPTCQVHPRLRVLLDSPAPGISRFTYAVLDARPARTTVLAIALFTVTDPIEGIPCFQTGCAVLESQRRKGIGALILRDALDEFRHGMDQTQMTEFYVEAVVGAHNLASNRIAARVLTDNAAVITDEISDGPAFQYLRLVKTR